MSSTDQLAALSDAVANDPGLPANIYQVDIDGGVAAAQLMNGVIMQAIEATGVNADGRISEADLYAVTAFIRADADLYADFVEGHGDDEGNEETGFHLVQGDGGALRFQGRDFVDTVADAIYHVGFQIVDGRYQNEDGNQNEKVEDVAGWLNFFLNGENVVYGSDAGETLHSGSYSFVFDAARDEVFEAGGGNDRIWAGDGDDVVYGGAGNDMSGGQEGNDRMFGGLGDDQMWGDEGNDLLRGQEGHDRLGGGLGNDKMYGNDGDDVLGGQEGDDQMFGGAGADVVYGDDGADLLKGGKGDDKIVGGAGKDKMYGGADDDKLYGEAHVDILEGRSGDDYLNGGDGGDVMRGGSGDDTLNGGNGKDMFRGGTGADLMQDWEDRDYQDTFVFGLGESGVGEFADEIHGFDERLDKIKLMGMGDLTFIDTAAFSGTGGEVRVANDLVQIDVDGDGAVDAEIIVKWVGLIEAGDFIL